MVFHFSVPKNRWREKFQVSDPHPKFSMIVYHMLIYFAFDSFYFFDWLIVTKRLTSYHTSDFGVSTCSLARLLVTSIFTSIAVRVVSLGQEISSLLFCLRFPLLSVFFILPYTPSRSKAFFLSIRMIPSLKVFLLFS